jgi:hypothetical protein
MEVFMRLKIFGKSTSQHARGGQTVYENVVFIGHNDLIVVRDIIPATAHAAHHRL